MRKARGRLGVLVLLLAMAAAVAGIHHLLMRDPGALVADRGGAPVEPPPVAGVATIPPIAAATPLPDLDRSDGWLRSYAAELSSDAGLARLLQVDALIRRFVATVDNVAEGASPVPHLRFLDDPRDFQVVRRGGRFYPDPRSYDRYRWVVAVVSSLDAQACARLYRTAGPLLDQAHRHLGYPANSFDASLGRAIKEILDTPVVKDDVELVPEVTTYRFVSTELQSLHPAQKILVRMGPENTARIQGKLRELAEVLGLPVA